MVGNFPQWEKKSLPLHGSFSTAAPVLYAGIHLPLFSQWALTGAAPFLHVQDLLLPWAQKTAD